MVNKCVVFGCKNGYDSQRKKIDDNHGSADNQNQYNSESAPDSTDNKCKTSPVFGFPFDKPDLNQRWIKFVNRKDWKPTNSSVICMKHFESKYIKVGKRARLLYDLSPVPTIYENLNVPLSMQPTPTLKT